MYYFFFNLEIFFYCMIGLYQLFILYSDDLFFCSVNKIFIIIKRLKKHIFFTLHFMP